MGVIIDVNTMPCVFNENNMNFQYFYPLLKWILEGKAKIIIGGTKYLKELQNLYSYYKLILELNKVGKVYIAPQGIVDEKEMYIVKQKIGDSDFDDPHIVALVVISECRILCSNDQRSFKYIQMKCFYPKGINRPKIFTSINRKPTYSLLNERNLSPCCYNPEIVLSKDQCRSFGCYHE